MSGVDNGCGSRLLKVTSNNIPQMEHYMLFRLMLFRMKMTIICNKLVTTVSHGFNAK